MNKSEFLILLERGLSGLPRNDIEERLNFYSEMIDDRMEDGLSEQEAVGEIGDMDEVITQIVADIPMAKLVKEKIKPGRRIKVWEIVFLILGSPVWLSLLIASFAVVIAIYVVVWSVIISLWAVEAAVVCSAVGEIAVAAAAIFTGDVLSGAAMVGAGIFCAGIAVFLGFGCKAASKGILLLTKKLALRIKNCFIKKGEIL